MCGSRPPHPSGGGQLEREELRAVYGCCDGFFSPHRSEGFGLGMAEALQLGVDVIVTAHCPVAAPASAPAPTPTPCADGHVWGEPDLDHAAEIMQQVAAYRQRLEELWGQRQELAGRLVPEGGGLVAEGNASRRRKTAVTGVSPR